MIYSDAVVCPRDLIGPDLVIISAFITALDLNSKVDAFQDCIQHSTEAYEVCMFYEISDPALT